MLTAWAQSPSHGRVRMRLENVSISCYKACTRDAQAAGFHTRFQSSSLSSFQLPRVGFPCNAKPASPYESRFDLIRSWPGCLLLSLVSISNQS